MTDGAGRRRKTGRWRTGRRRSSREATEGEEAAEGGEVEGGRRLTYIFLAQIRLRDDTGGAARDERVKSRVGQGWLG